jgi:hypothetical protein
MSVRRLTALPLLLVAVVGLVVGLALPAAGPLPYQPNCLTVPALAMHHGAAGRVVALAVPHNVGRSTCH